ncbi:MAG: TAT-variant-translocated molybdopterin oxidoreductase [Bryobacterales bacterium]|nr:TAT-variant-translocated molybdopterin oxidoreductase [Bryobacterales bacterium]
MIVKIQDILKAEPAKTYWRSTSQLAETDKFQEWKHREFQDGASELPEGASRRTLLKFMGATLALAGLTACRRPEELILPLANGAEDLIPGKPVFYNSIFTLHGVSTGVMVETHDGRPTKIEGNALHPQSRGAASAFAQASILGLYDPDRISEHTRDGSVVTWDEIVAALPSAFNWEGSKLRFLSQRIGSPTYLRLKAEILAKFPGAKWVEYEPVPVDNAREGARLAFGRPLQVNYDFSKSQVILALDYDFLGLDAPTTLYMRQWADGRRIRGGSDSMNRVYAVESQYSITGAMADHRLRIRATDVMAVLQALAARLGVLPAAVRPLPPSEKAEKFIEVLAGDLGANKGKCVLAVGPRQPAEVHALAHLVNEALGNLESAVTLLPVTDGPGEFSAIKQLAADLDGGGIETLVVLGGNPVYDAPADTRFEEKITRAKNRIYLGEDRNETAFLSNWVLQGANYLETWGDGRALDGFASIQQPMILPLFDGKSPIELLAAILDAPEKRGYALVRETWKAQLPDEKSWRKAVHDGLIAGTATAPITANVNRPAVLEAVTRAGAGSNPDQIELVFVPSSHAYDGRFNNNAWMLEAPDPITKITWDNVALLSQATAAKLGLRTDVSQINTSDSSYKAEFISIKLNDAEVKLPAVVQPGHADNSITLAMGFGRTKTGQVGSGAGFNIFPLISSSAPTIALGAEVSKTSGSIEIASTQDHGTLTDALRTRSEIVREVTLEDFRKDQKAIQEIAHKVPEFNLYASPPYTSEYQWGMTVDLNTCTGCNACLVACQSENNIPTVGKEQVLHGREMHWIRLDRYYSGSVEDAEMVYQPMACVHCENAPCENVCPVAATTHSSEGINEMVYNRCVGTRYCSNNCPYKVRRFNFFNYHDKRLGWMSLGNKAPEIASLQYNPDVTVRMRGIMEKCTYCVQRISQARISAKAEGRSIRDGEVLTACQQTCPTNSITFGNIADPESAVSKLKALDTNYAVLQELNVKPRTTYLGKLRNPHPELV